MTGSTYLQSRSRRKPWGLGVVVLLHLLVFWAIQAGLTRDITRQIAGEDELQVDLFAAPEVPESAGASPLEAALASINPDALSPREALDALYQLKKMAG